MAAASSASLEERSSPLTRLLQDRCPARGSGRTRIEITLVI
jgi:hypothetical protein